LDGGTLTGEAASRLGEAHNIQISKSDFVDIFSFRAKHGGHINVLEGEAYIMFLRWLLRACANHNRRVVVLLDSSVWLGAAAKGRSSSQLNRLLKKAAALTMAGNLQLHLIMVPSEDNPADLPSRGAKRRGLVKKCTLKQPSSRQRFCKQWGRRLGMELWGLVKTPW